MFSLVVFNSIQTFERITVTEAALTYRSVNANEIAIWKGLLFSGICVTAILCPWLGSRIGVKYVAVIGAVMASFVAFCLFLIDLFASDDQIFINLVQALAPFAGISDCMSAFAVLAAVINTTPQDSRGWNFGLMFALISVAFILGIDHEGVMSSLGVLSTTDESCFTTVCLILVAISLISLFLISRTIFEDPERKPSNIIGAEDNISYRWWITLTMPAVRWSCFVVTAYALILEYIKTEFSDELQDIYGWSTDNLMNISLITMLGFLLTCPLVGWFGEIYGSLTVMTAGNFALAGALLVLALVINGAQVGTITVAFSTLCFGICSAPSVVVSLINMQENLEVEYEGISGSAASSLYLCCWLIGLLLGAGLDYKIDNDNFQEMAYECCGGEACLGLIAAVFSGVNLLRQPVYQDEFAKQLARERLKKVPYVVESSWEAIP